MLVRAPATLCIVFLLITTSTGRTADGSLCGTDDSRLCLELKMRVQKMQPSIQCVNCSQCLKCFQNLILEAYNLLDTPVCGQVNPRWFGDSGNASQLYYPWAVSITDAAGKSFCGGTLLNKQEILTAGHCLSGKSKEELGLILGVHDISRAVDSDRYKVKSFVVHSDFKKNPDNTFENDLAVITMENPLASFHPSIRPICFPTNPINYNKNNDVIVLGWGQLSADVENTAQKLQMLERSTLPLASCETLWNKKFNPGQNICMGEGGHNICKGDEGGPLMVENYQGRFVLIGIASFSGTVCGDDKPGVYSNFEYYRDWIMKNSRSPECE